ncbi:MAG: IS701 family transposase [Solirubrobacteraceae bacterium MAG38_C4-C5]|nr:IS701 family transposase [Candidatus Siliceabacter maunaloa]
MESVVVDSRSEVDAPSAVKERLEAFAGEVLGEAMNRPVQVFNGGLYLRGLVEQGPRKSLEPMVARLGEEADYQSLQQFLADSPWEPALVVRVAERVAPAIDVQAWVLDDTGFVKDGRHSPGGKRQYSGTLGKIGNCQIGVSAHAVGAKGTVPLGWALYLPEEWCEDPERRRRAKIPAEVEFKTKPQLGVELVQRAAGWEVPTAPVLGDQAYGENTDLRERLDDGGLEYVLAVGAETKVFGPETHFAVPARTGARGRPPSRPRPDRQPESIGQLIARIGPDGAQSVAFRDGPDGEPATSRFVFVCVRAAHDWAKRTPCPPRGMADRRVARGSRTADRLLAGQPARRHPTRAPRAPGPPALEDRAGLPPAQGRVGPRPLRGALLPGLAAPRALVTAAHGFLTLERLCPRARRPA